MDLYKETYNTWNKIAHLYQDRFMDLDLYDDTYDLFCNEVHTVNAAILEIGCGPGNITKYLLNKRPDFSMDGIDYAPNMIALAKSNIPTANFTVMDCRAIAGLQRKYDGIICGFCLPYLSATESSKLIYDCGNLLLEKGILYLSFVEGDTSQSGFQTASSGDRMYFYFHRLESLTKELTSNGFQSVKILNKNYRKSIGTDELHTIIVAGK